MSNNPRIAKLDFLARRRGVAFALRIHDVTATPSERGDLFVDVEGEWEGSVPHGLPPPALVIDDGQRSHRFTALPSPTPRGGPHAAEHFRARFAVPDDLDACLVAPFVLFVGKQAQPLPDARRIERARAGPRDLDGPGPAVLAERRAERAEQAEQLAHERSEGAITRVRELESELEAERRAEAEAQHAADAATAARERALRALADRERVFADALGVAELELKSARDRLDRSDATALVQRVGLAQRISELQADGERLQAELRHSDSMHEEAVSEMGRRLADERAQHERNLAILRRQVQALHGQLDRTGAGFREQLRAERHARRALEAKLRALDTVAPLDEATQRPEPWLPQALTAMADADPAAAGRLALAILPGQSATVPRPLDYDLELRDAGWFRVTVGDDAAEVVSQPGPRARRNADFRVRADAGGLAALVTGGDTSRLRITATRSRSAARDALCAVPGSVLELHAAGVRPDPLLLYAALARGIEPIWTTGHEFTVAQELSDAEGGCVIVVRNGEPVRVTAERPDPVTATVRCTYATLARLLSAQAAAVDDKPAIRGDAVAVARLNGWLRRAQGIAPNPAV